MMQEICGLDRDASGGRGAPREVQRRLKAVKASAKKRENWEKNEWE